MLLFRRWTVLPESFPCGFLLVADPIWFQTSPSRGIREHGNSVLCLHRKYFDRHVDCTVGFRQLVRYDIVKHLLSLMRVNP